MMRGVQGAHGPMTRRRRTGVGGASRSGSVGAERRSSLFWRLLPTYLVVIAVAAATTLLSAESFAPYFLRHHVDPMMQGLARSMMPTMPADMAGDLNAAYRRALSQSILWSVLAAAATSGLAALFVTRRIVAPLRAMRRASRRIAEGRYHDRLATDAPGEVGDLAVAFNAMADTLEHTENTRMQLLTDVAHEFRTPLGNLRGYVEGIEDGVFRAEPAVFDACRRQLERLDRLLHDLNLLSRIESGQVELAPGPVEASDLLARAAAAITPAFRQKGVQLQAPAPASLPTVLADPDRTAQVFDNLLRNALRFTPRGRAVSLGARRVAGGVRFEVADEGPGIDPVDLPHVFRRFYRGDKSRGHGDGVGSGIGLTIARELVLRQGGDMGVDSRAGNGAHFWFTLPRADRADRS